MSSYDPMLSAFAPTKYLGPTNNRICITNYDQSALVAGSSSELFNELNLTVENMPIQPLLVTARGVDTILAIDAERIDCYARSGHVTVISVLVPSCANVFYGMYRTEPYYRADLLWMQHDKQHHALVIYLANGGFPHHSETTVTNTATLQVSYSSSEIQAMLVQTFIIATQGFPAESSMTTDPEWPACLACTVVDRARKRAGEARSGVCVTCFARYWWSGSTVALGHR
ncbi:hypothetical protein OG21DRAFT_1568824 [Imleria badia]|nr:hypothetical protein OG21DRAFT_1568824 [Imleria badia]